MSKLLKAALYVNCLLLFMSLSLEFLLRFSFPDPSYYWDFRFLFESPNAFENRTDRVWTYRANSVIREVAVYVMPSLFSFRPRVVVEYDCFMRSNNLGLLQDQDVRTDRAWTVIIGDSFTAGQGGCPWIGRLQAHRPDDNILNGGLQGTGVAQWGHLLEYLRQQGLKIKRILLIAISEDFKRPAAALSQAALDCLNYNVCSSIDMYIMPVSLKETHNELEERSMSRFLQRFGNIKRIDLITLYFAQNSYLFKIASTAIKTLGAMIGGGQAAGRAGIQPEADAALAGR